MLMSGKLYVGALKIRDVSTQMQRSLNEPSAVTFYIYNILTDCYATDIPTETFGRFVTVWQFNPLQ